MGLFTSKKGKIAPTTTEYNPYFPQSPQSRKGTNSGYSPIALSKLEKKDFQYKQRIRILRFITRTISLILSGFMIGTLSYTLAKYFTTRHIQISNTHIWGAPKVLWPTYLILGIATVTFILNAATLVAYLCSIKAANTSGNLTIYTGYFMLGIEVIVWAVSSAVYKMADNGTDLWGYSCGDNVDQTILTEAKSFVDFGMLCNGQNGTWFATITQAVLHFLTFVTMVLVWRREKGKKKVQTVRESLLLSGEYSSNF